MSQLSIHRSPYPTPPLTASPRQTLRRGLAALRAALVLTARAIGWFAARPGPLQVALLGISVCVATGAAIGLVAGQVVARVVFVLLGVVDGP